MSSIAIAGMLITGSFVVAPAAQAASVVGICTIKANLPHASTHVNGTINGTATITCSEVMTEIYLRVKIEKITGATKLGTTTDQYGVSRASGNAFVSCSNPGKYRIIAEYVLRAPPGFTPVRAASNLAGPYASVACGVSSRGTSTQESGGSEESGSFEQTVEIELKPAS